MHMWLLSPFVVRFTMKYPDCFYYMACERCMKKNSQEKFEAMAMVEAAVTALLAVGKRSGSVN